MRSTKTFSFKIKDCTGTVKYEGFCLFDRRKLNRASSIVLVTFGEEFDLWLLESDDRIVNLLEMYDIEHPELGYKMFLLKPTKYSIPKTKPRYTMYHEKTIQE